MALLGEAGGESDIRDRLAGFEYTAGGAYAVPDLHHTGGRPVRSREPDEAELPDAGRGGEFVEPDVALGAVGEVVELGARPRVAREGLGLEDLERSGRSADRGIRDVGGAAVTVGLALSVISSCFACFRGWQGREDHEREPSMRSPSSAWL
jgi:hypothetical protein